MDITIVGGRDFNNYPVLKMSMWNTIALFDLDPKQLTFHSGRARGADSLGEKFAQSIHAPLIFYVPDWDRFGRSAGIRRNIEMSDAVGIIVAFFDGVSRGTKHMIEYSQSKNKLVIIYDYEGKLVSRHGRD